MPILRTKPEDIANWLRAEFSNATIDVHWIDKRLVYLFRVHDRDRSPFPTLEVSEEALEDWEPQVILGDLRNDAAVEQIRSRPDSRHRYSASRQLSRDDTVGYNGKEDQ